MEHLGNIFRKKGRIFDGTPEMVNDLFEEALFFDDEETMKALIFPDSSVLSAERTNRKLSFLHILCYKTKPNIVIVQLLIDFGINIDKQDTNDDTALHAATSYKFFGNCVNIVRVLLKNGANRNIRNKKDLTPIQVALLSGNLEVAEEFLNEKDKLPNMIEVDRIIRCRHLVKCLLWERNNCNISSTNYSVLSHFTVLQNDEEAFEYVVNNSKFHLNAVYNKFITLLNLVAEKGTPRMIIALINIGADLDNDCPYNGKTPLIVAIINNRIEMVQFLLDCEVSVNKRQESQKEDNSPLHYAVCMQNIDIVEKLLKMGADVNARTYHRSPLLLACSAITWSEKWPSPCNTRTLRGGNYLRYAGYCLNDNFLPLSVKIVEVLLDYGADIEAKNASERTALDQACRFRQLEIVKLLLSRGAKINQGAVSTLHHAVRGENPTIVELILKQGADVNHRCAPEKKIESFTNYVEPPPRTPLECAVKFIKRDSVCKKVVEVLMKYDVNVNVADPVEMETPLHLACLCVKVDDFINGYCSSKTKTFQLLLECNANINALNSKGLVPLYYALRNYVLMIVPNSTENSFNRFKPNLVTLIAFIAKMIEVKTKKCVIEENLVLLDDASARPIYEECVKELNLMKKNICESRNLSFFNILFKDIKYLGSAINNEDILQVLNSGEYKKNFPIYAEYLEDRIREAADRQSLVDLAIFIFQKHVYKRISIELILYIFKFLNPKDLKSFAKACFVDIECK